jgi:MFS family permease|tara:strand:+ start:207 stop:1466 length:1260 start_codon:yes stop_codon:yes gene_type:complete
VGSETRRPGGLKRAFSHRNFLIYFLGNFPSQIGVWAQRTALGWLAWKMTDSAFYVGLLGFADLIPIILLSPFSGYLTDRFDRLVLGKIITIANIFVTGALAILGFADLLTIELLVLFAFLTGVDHAMFQPVRSTLMGVLTSKEDLSAAIAINGFSWNSARFIGPAVAGVALQFTQETTIFAANAVLYLWFLISFWLLNVPKHRASKPVGNDSAIGQIIAGYRYIYNHGLIGPLLAILACASLLTRPLVELLPVASGAMFDRGVDGLAMLTSAMGIGAMCAGYWIAQRGRLEGMAKITANTLLATLVVLLVFATTTNFYVAVGCMWCIGFQYSTYATCIQTMIQTVAEDHMRGRVLALYGMIWIGFAGIGALIVGGLADLLGLRVPLAAAGILCLGVWYWASKRLKKIDEELKNLGHIGS